MSHRTGAKNKTLREQDIQLMLEKLDAILGSDYKRERNKSSLSKRKHDYIWKHKTERSRFLKKKFVEFIYHEIGDAIFINFINAKRPINNFAPLPQHFIGVVEHKGKISKIRKQKIKLSHDYSTQITITFSTGKTVKYNLFFKIMLLLVLVAEKVEIVIKNIIRDGFL